jgi:hypothetical protein
MLLAVPGPTRRRTELHVAFVAPDRAGVEAFGAAARSIGAEILHEPRVFPEYNPDDDGCFVRDPTGTTLRLSTGPRRNDSEIGPSQKLTSSINFSIFVKCIDSTLPSSTCVASVPSPSSLP